MMIFTVWFEMSPNLREYLTFFFFFKDANILKALLEHLKDIGFTELKQGGICLSRFEMEAIQDLILGSTYLGTVHFHLLLQ